jgi:hypothetical protein
MGLWNVGGLISKQFNKTTDPEFLRKIDNFDLLFLVETHLGPDHNISKIGSYYCNLICRPKTKANNTYKNYNLSDCNKWILLLNPTSLKRYKNVYISCIYTVH